MIMAATLTENDVGDPLQVAPLLDQVDAEIVSVTADGAYDGAPTYVTVATHSEDIAVVIPPPVTAVLNDAAALNPSQRDRHIAMIQAQGRLGWQKETGYGRRSLVETTMGRYKAIIGPRLRARSLSGERAEAAVGVAVLNRMLYAARPTPSATRPALLEIDGQRDPSPEPRSMQQRRLAAVRSLTNSSC